MLFLLFEDIKDIFHVLVYKELCRTFDVDVTLFYKVLRRTSHHQFFVQREHGLMWCKVGSYESSFRFCSDGHICSNTSFVLPPFLFFHSFWRLSQGSNEEFVVGTAEDL